MSKRSGTSHALAALVSLLLGSLLVEYLRPNFPRLIAVMDQGAAWLGKHIPLSSSIVNPAIVAAILAFVWGALYHRIRHGSA